MDFVTRLRPNENDSDGKLYDKVVLLDERSVMASRKKIDPKYPQVVILSPQVLSGVHLTVCPIRHRMSSSYAHFRAPRRRQSCTIQPDARRHHRELTDHSLAVLELSVPA